MTDRGNEEEEPDIVYEVQGTHSKNDALVAIVPAAMQSTPSLAAMALAITAQGWKILGHGTDANVMESADFTITVERATSLILIRLVALLSDRNQQLELPDPNIPTYTDLSTTTICRSALVRGKPWAPPISAALIQQVRDYVRRILGKYNGVYYHNFEHAYHVTLSCNKLLDMILNESDNSTDRHGRRHEFKFRSKTYGLKSDPLMQLALVFSALIHDLEHRGVPNRQLVLESDDLAILYNDQSVAEQRSLAVAFSELMKEEFTFLRNVMFDTPEEYRRFRQAVVNLVLSTDVASPERTQLTKSKWTEAFGPTQESLDRKSRRAVFVASKVPAKTKTSTGHLSSTSSSIGITKEASLPLNVREPTRSTDPSTGLSNRLVAFSEVTIDAALLNRAAAADHLTNIESEEETTSATPESTDGLEEYSEGEMLDASDGFIFTASTMPSDTTTGTESANAPRAMPRKTRCSSLQPGYGGSTHNNHDTLHQKRHSTSQFMGSFDEQSMSAMSCPTPLAQRMRGTMNRRYSNPVDAKTHSVRLGIRRSLDLTGEQIEHYVASTRSPNPSRSTTSVVDSSSANVDWDADESDPLKISVVMEQIMRSADVSANMQSFEHMEKWSHRLFFELKASFHDGRGEDPQNGWYENQITFLDSYILPLARRMDDTGVFGEMGKQFAVIVLHNRDRWVIDGCASTSHVIQEWNMVAAKEGSKVDTR